MSNPVQDNFLSDLTIWTILSECYIFKFIIIYRNFNFFILQTAKCRVRYEAHNLKTEDLLMCCLVRATPHHISMKPWWNGLTGGKHEETRRITCSNTTSSTTNIKWYNHGLDPRLHEENLACKRKLWQDHIKILSEFFDATVINIMHREFGRVYWLT